MRLKTFRAFSLSEALDAVQEDLGPTASILHTRTFKQGGFLGLGSRDVVEVIASEARDGAGEQGSGAAGEPESTTESEPVSASVATPTQEAGQRQAARRAYARGEDDAVPVTAPSSARSGTLEVDRDRTRRLAQAMAIRLEKQQAARRAAGVSSSGDLLTGVEPHSSPMGTPEATESVESDVTSSSIDAVAEAAAEPRLSQKTDRFIIGAGGVLIPDADADLESASPSSASTDLDETAVEACSSEVADLPAGVTPRDGNGHVSMPAVSVPSPDVDSPRELALGAWEKA